MKKIPIHFNLNFINEIKEMTNEESKFSLEMGLPAIKWGHSYFSSYRFVDILYFARE